MGETSNADQKGARYFKADLHTHSPASTDFQDKKATPKEYVEAANCLALPAGRIVFRHMLPNCLPSLIVIATITLARAIALEATLSFLGVGVPVTQPSLGMLISNGFEFLLSGSYWISFFPGVALAIAIIGINLAGDHLRDVLNPRNLR